EQNIPVGFNGHDQSPIWGFGQLSRDLSQHWKSFKDLDKRVQDLEGRARSQMGSLGGGNHFIELCLDSENNVWMMLHSGSRHIGKSLAEIHIARARELVHNVRLPDRDLGVFLAGTPEMQAYRRDLYWAQNY